MESAETPDARPHPEAHRPPVIGPGHTFASVTDKISTVVLSRRVPRGWIIGVAISSAMTMMLFYSLAYLCIAGIGIWGVNIPVGWGFAIINFVWWIGIGHAGTLISAILLLLRQDWRTSINRFAEAMTLFAVAQAGLYPLFHVGRPWVGYWLFPYPNNMGVWPQFRSPLVWDVFAVSTYATVSAMFWFIGLIPDLATLRDRAQNRAAKIIYGMLAMGWRGSAKHWHRYETTYLLLAGLATPLVLSVHTVVSFDFAIGIVPGWHSTIFPPYFVAGAIYAGFAMVLLIAIPLRWAYGLEDFITMRHLQNMCKVMMATGLVVFYGYIMEAFFGWYSGSRYEWYMTKNRVVGPYGVTYWALIFCNGFAPQIFWFSWARSNIPLMFIVSIIVSIGMWLERFVIVVTSLHRDFVPSSWGNYYPTKWDLSTYFGTIGFFVLLIYLFIRVLPMISIFEMRTILPEAEIKEEEA